MTVGSLFSGIGGLDLGLEWAGFETKWFCEIEKFPQAVLRKHWPNTPIIEDVRNVTKGNVQHVDVIAGGFPCQDISWAGIGRGIDYDLSEQEGTRSGLWWEMWRVIRELRPRYVIAENVPALTHRGLDIVLGSLAQIGYDAEWQTISAASVGASHIRERVFIVAYPKSERAGRGPGFFQEKNGRQSERLREPIEPSAGHVAYAMQFGQYDEREQGDSTKKGGGRRSAPERQEDWQHTSRQRIGQAFVAYANSKGFSGRRQQHPGKDRCAWSESVGGEPNAEYVAYPSRERCEAIGWAEPSNKEQHNRGDAQMEGGPSWFAGPIGQPWPVSFKQGNKCVEAEYDFRGVAYGVSDRVGALKGYGNAVVPQVGYLVGRAVREHAEENGWWK